MQIAMRTHKDLEVWKKSIALVTKIYEITSDFPRKEMFGLTNQIRRCSISIPSIVAEGSARAHQKGIYSISSYFTWKSPRVRNAIYYR